MQHCACVSRAVNRLNHSRDVFVLFHVLFQECSRRPDAVKHAHIPVDTVNNLALALLRRDRLRNK